MGFPEDWLDDVMQQQAQQPQGPGGPGIPGVANPDEPVTAQDLVNNPTPGNVTDMLMGGGVGFTQ